MGLGYRNWAGHPGYIVLIMMLPGLWVSLVTRIQFGLGCDRVIPGLTDQVPTLMCVKVEVKLGQVRSGLELSELGMFYLMALIIMPGSNPFINGLKN